MKLLPPPASTAQSASRKRGRFASDVSAVYTSHGLISPARHMRISSWNHGSGLLRSHIGKSLRLGLICLFVAIAHFGRVLTISAQVVNLAVTTGHADRVTQVAISPDGSIVATGSWDSTAILWELRTGRELRRLRGHTDHIQALAYSPSGQLVATGGDDGSVVLWKPSDGTVVDRIDRARETYNQQAVQCVAFDNKGERLIFVYFDGSVVLWSPPQRPVSLTTADKISGLDVNCGFVSDGSTIWVTDDEVHRWHGDTLNAYPPFRTGFSDTTVYRAVSPDGTRLVEAGSKEVRVTEIQTNRALWRYQVESLYAELARFSSRGRFVFVSAHMGSGLLFDSTTGQVLREFHSAQKNEIHGVAFSDDDSKLLTGSWDNSARLWKVSSGELEQEFKTYSREPELCGLANIRLCVTDLSDDGVSLIWPLKGGTPSSKSHFLNALSPDGGYGIAFAPQFRLAELEPLSIKAMASKNPAPRFSEVMTSKAIRYSSDGGQIVVASGKEVRVLRVGDWSPLGIIEHPSSVTSVDVSDDHERILTGDTEGVVRIWAMDGKQPIFASQIFSPRGFSHGKPYVSETQFSHDRRFALFTHNPMNEGAFVDLVKKEYIDRWSGSGEAPTGWSFSKDGRYFARAEQGGILLFSLGSEVDEKLIAASGVQRWSPIAFSNDSSRLAVSGQDGAIKILSVTGSDSNRDLIGHTGRLKSLNFTSDNRFLISTSDDGTVRVWSWPEGKAMATIATLAQGHWVVVTPEGRFDTDSFQTHSPLGWVLGDDPFRSIEVGAFMRDYYTPGLLTRLIIGDTPAPARKIETLNRALPELYISKVEGEVGHPEYASVTIRIAPTRSWEQFDPKGRILTSGAYDLHLFRDGHLVDHFPRTQEDDVPEYSLTTGTGIEVWRSEHAIRTDAAGTAIVVLKHIQLPCRKDAGQSVSFTAYAFNSDRLKSDASPSYSFVPSCGELTRKRKKRAYLVTSGVNANESHWNLEVAVPSARRAEQLLQEKLRQTYEDVIPVSMYSDLDENGPKVAADGARKDRFEAVFQILAGKAISPGLRDKVDPQHRLERATPDDTVVFYIAAHGYVDPRGSFYLIPYDTGPAWGLSQQVLTDCQESASGSAACLASSTFLQHSISSSDLGKWWQGVDAGDMVMILDSCHSGAVPGNSFRAGPLGDPGLGQLSYDKGMRILCAAQAEQTEQGDWIDGKGSTLLVQSLETMAKTRPEETLGNWLRAVREQLPVLMSRLYPNLTEDEIQIPLLMDFAERSQ
jgi:WD40 repeat protein